MARAASLTDDQLLDTLQRAACEYFLTYADDANGLVSDTSRSNAPASIAVVGFALSVYPVAAERGWMSRAAAARRTLATLRFFSTCSQSEAPDASGWHGLYYHFLDMKSGARAWQCELSLIDSAFFIAGVLTAAAYFDADTGIEREIRVLADALYSRVDWQWALNDKRTLAQGWKPEVGFLHYGWEGYNEAMLLYVLAAGSRSEAVDRASYAAWCETYQWENIYGTEVLYGGPLFMHLFSHAWIDFRGIRDDFMREKRSDYFRNSCAAIAVQREYARRNPWRFEAYGADCWGLTACDGPTGGLVRGDRFDLRYYGYAARGVPYGPDDGTIAPWAMLACLPFDAPAALSGTRFLLERYPEVCRSFQFAGAFNARVEGQGFWVSEGAYGLDQGLLVLMIENYRSGLIWRLMRGQPAIRKGLKRAGFTGGWLGRSARARGAR